jgi:hypothetical protein
MRNPIVVLAVILAACSASRPAEPPPTDGRVVLETFTADVDLEAGTIDIRQIPETSETSGQLAKLVNLDASVTVARSGSAWINTSDNPCTNGDPGSTWGANVTVKNNLVGTSLSGVYAEITTAPPAMTGRESCSNPIFVPTGLSTTYGLWSYGLISPGETKEASNWWIFKYTTAASRFSFSGRIIGVKVDPAAVSGGIPMPVSTSYVNSVADNGTTILVSDIQNLAIYFVNSTTGLLQSTQTIAEFGATAIAVAPNRIWYGSQAYYSSEMGYRVGWMDLNGGNKGFGDVAGDIALGRGVVTIVPDPVTPDTKAWVFYNNDMDNSYVQSYSITGGAGTVTALGTYAPSAALGADNRLYATAMLTQEIIPIRLDTDPATVTPAISTADAACMGPNIVARGKDGKLYFSATDSFPAQVCSVSVTGTVASVGYLGVASSGLAGIAVTAAGEAWGATSTGVERVGSWGHSLDAPVPGGSGSAALIANGYLWATADGKLWRVTIQ